MFFFSYRIIRFLENKLFMLAAQTFDNIKRKWFINSATNYWGNSDNQSKDGSFIKDSVIGHSFGSFCNEWQREGMAHFLHSHILNKVNHSTLYDQFFWTMRAYFQAATTGTAGESFFQCHPKLFIKCDRGEISNSLGSWRGWKCVQCFWSVIYLDWWVKRTNKSIQKELKINQKESNSSH